MVRENQEDGIVTTALIAPPEQGQLVSVRSRNWIVNEVKPSTLYEVRPTVCREYPHTGKDRFTFRTMGVSSNVLVCPAVFWIVEQMKRRALG